MLHKSTTNLAVFAITVFTVCVVLFALSGCSSDSPTTTTTGNNDPNVVSYNDFDIVMPLTPGIDLFLGKNTHSGFDVSVIQPGVGEVYYFKSGDLAGGFKTGFFLVDSTISESGFGSISTVSAWGSSGAAITDTTLFLSNSSTAVWGTIGNPSTIFPVYGFYLAGKFANGTTGTSRVFGLMHVNSVTGGGANPIKINISVRYNKAGLNKF